MQWGDSVRHLFRRRQRQVGPSALDALSCAMREAAELEVWANAQFKLTENLALLRRLVFARGKPALVEGDLVLGQQRASTSHEIVDRVKQEAGGAATIFAEDRRVSTNVLLEDGRRATGTRLEPGPIYDSLFKHQLTYSGEVRLFGRPHIAIYEPLVVGSKTIGALFVAVEVAGELSSMLPSLDSRYPDLVFARVASFFNDRNSNRRRTLEALAKLQGRELDRRRRQVTQDELRLAQQSEQAVILKGAATTLDQGLARLSDRSSRQADMLEAASKIVLSASEEVEKANRALNEAKQIAGDADRRVRESSDILQAGSSAISSIELASRQITSIISVIDKLAAETNLLALNATIEAARVGEAGRGFAIVASEVKSLADKTKESAQAVKQLVTSCVDAVRAGAVHFDRSDQALATIKSGNEIVSSIVRDVAASSELQTVRLHEVCTVLSRVSHSTKEDAQAVADLSKATNQVAGQCGGIVEQTKAMLL